MSPSKRTKNLNLSFYGVLFSSHLVLYNCKLLLMSKRLTSLKFLYFKNNVFINSLRNSYNGFGHINPLNFSLISTSSNLHLSAHLVSFSLHPAFPPSSLLWYVMDLTEVLSLKKGDPLLPRS